MKKILLFIFTFGIIFSLYNVKAFANTAIDNAGTVIVIESSPDTYQIFGYSGIDIGIIYGGVRDGIPYYYIQGSYLGWSQPVTQFNSYQNAVNYLENIQYFSYDGNNNYTVNGNEIGIVKGTVYNIPNTWTVNNVDPSIDVYQCAFFFEPEPGTDLYSMYCFPQELDDNEVVTVHYNNLNNIGFEITSASVDTLKRCYLENGNINDYYNSIEYWLEMIDQVKLENENVIDFLFTTPIYAIYCDFIENNGNPNYNIFPLTEKSWWDDIVNQIGFEDTELGFIWEWLFGDPDPDYHNVIIENSPSPTPLPTPIPYRTTLVPDGNGGYEFQYEYEDENGNTITASAPPEQPNYDGNALVTQAVNMNISGVPVSDVEGVQSLLNVIGEADQEYQEGFQVIGKSFAILPSKWFMFFGIPAAIILIAGIIKSLLG